tara:strand:- start:1353 stop:2033 length:681 start_codon:yes stop_codon:yes gene_type:complete
MTELRTQTIEIHELEDLDLSTVSEKGQRFYTDSTGKIKYPSVTTVVGLKNREQIKLWRERVGSEEANRITKYATNRGTNFHEKVEQYLRKEVPYIEFDNLIEEGMFKGIKPVLDEITPIALEAPLYSDHLKMAGRVDCIGILDGALSIIDFKTSSKYKKEEYADTYYLQMTAYAIMVEELTGKPVDDIVALVALENGHFQLFVANPIDYVDELMELRTRYKNLYGV